MLEFPSPYRALGVLLGLLATAACSSNVAETTGSGGQAASSGSSAVVGSSSSSSGAATTSSGTGSSGTGGFDAGGVVTTYTGSVSEPGVVPGYENTQCIYMSLANPDAAFVRRFRATLNPGTHHMIMYRADGATENLTPVNCQPFSGLLSGEHPIFIAQQEHAELDFPDDADGTPVGLEIAANQMVKIELHFLNTTMSTLNVVGTINVDTVPLVSKIVQSDLAFWGTTNINIPPHSTFETPVNFQFALPNTKAFALTTHQHHLGTEMRIWYANSATDINQAPVADGTNWQDPPLDLFTPPLDFPAAAGATSSSMGFAYQCTWDNTTANTVTFGESAATQEMCFLWQYYFPSQGFQLCFDGICKPQTM